MTMLAALLLAAAQPAADDPASAAYKKLRALVGAWQPADRPDSPLRIRFYETAKGSVLVEAWERVGTPHSLTLYHRDGPRLIATHYCPQGNQPRLALTADTTRIRFAYQDATDLGAGESHLHDLTFDLTDPQRPVRGETYRQGVRRSRQRSLSCGLRPTRAEIASGALQTFGSTDQAQAMWATVRLTRLSDHVIGTGWHIRAVASSPRKERCRN